ncbi:MAG: branched-chain amino acid ABC transporter permease [Chloroflexi bacterium]|nr:branched-chain amino acid ABC transporter permease [Chloroflexota bacterium]MBM3175266.1 branched-chain amino acid ABC transporter permease [Chloroflexota bacterium]MBM4451153.1 branched-chain amino acid ABC transporter permease [Chloroflexota bacterium]
MQPCGTFSSNYAQDMAIIRTRTQWVLAIAGLIVLFTLPLYCNDPILSRINSLAIMIVAVLGLMILTGYAGQINLGQAAFVCVGAYSSALMVTRLGLPFWVAMPLSGVSAGVVGLIFGLPSLRVKGFYLAMTTLAAQFIIPTLIAHVRTDITGGGNGLIVPPPYLGKEPLNTQTEMFFVIIPIVVILTFVAKSLVRGPIGRAFIAIRDNELAAESMGINVFRYKLLAFFICSFFAGISGSLWAHWLRLVHYDLLTIMESVWYLGMMIIGGMGSITGAIIGPIFVYGLDQILTWAAHAAGDMFAGVPATLPAAIRLVVFGVIIILFLAFEPRGLNHRWEVFKAAYRLTPFSY